DGRVFEMRTDWIARELRRWRSGAGSASSKQLLEQLQTLRTEAERFRRTPADTSALRARAADILSSREFRSIHGPTWLDRMRQRVFELINRLFVGVLGSSAFPTISPVVVYVLLLPAGITAVAWLLKARRRRVHAAIDLRVAAPATVVAWTHLLAEAERAAANGQWRDAIHFSYWCAVAF